MVSSKKVKKKGFDRSRNIKFLIWLILIEACWLLGTKISEMLLDFITEISFTEIQIAESLFSYTIALTILFWGYLLDRYTSKRKLILLVSSTLWISGSIALFFVEVNYTIFCVIQILWGLSFGANGPILASYLGDIFKIKNRGKLFSIFTIFVYLIKGSNIAINGLIGELMGNWKFPTFLFAIFGIIILILFMIYGKEPLLASNEPEFLELKDFEYDYRIDFDEIGDIVKKRTNLMLLIQGIFGMIGVVIVTKYLNYWFTSAQYDGLNINTGLSILLLGSGGVIGALIGIISVGRWIDAQFKKGNVNRILLFSIICLFLQVGFYFLLILGIEYPKTIDESIIRLDIFLNLYPAFLAFILIFNICVFCGTPIGTTVGVARTHINLPEQRGTAGALYDLTDFIGSGIGILIGSLLMNLFESYRLTILYGSLAWVISGVFWLAAMKFIGEDFKFTRKMLRKRAIKEKES